jgi:uncharacterized protein
MRQPPPPPCPTAAHRGDANAKEALQGQTALMWAAAERHPDAVKLLVENGADVRARTLVPEPRKDEAPNANALAPSTRADGFTPLLFAARVGDIESARILLQAGANANDTTASGLSALVLATVRGHSALATFLLENGANPNADDAGYAALHWAAGTWESELTVRAITDERPGEWYTIAGLKEGKLELVKALLAHGADPNLRMKKAPARAGGSKNAGLPELAGATPLVLAAMAGAPDVMHALVAAGADPRLRTDANGTVLMAAAGLGHVQGENSVSGSAALAAAQAALALGLTPRTSTMWATPRCTTQVT